MKKYTLNILGCENAREYLTSALEGGYLSHAYIIEGADGTGRHTLIRELLKAMACEEENAPCGKCGPCIKIDAGVCVDVYTIKVAEGKTELTVDLIRGIYDTVGLMPNDLPFKAYIIENGEKMNGSAQNAFLKLFEEPPEDVYFFIITNDADSLLPTIRSRALTLRTGRLDNETMMKALSAAGIPDNGKSRAAVAMADGSAGEAIKIYNNDSDLISLRAVSDALLDALLLPDKDKLSFVNLNHKNIKTLDNLYGVYGLMKRAVRDVMMLRLGIDGQALYFDSLESAEPYSLNISDSAAVRVDEIINELLCTSGVPLNLALAVTEFASRIWDAHLI